MKIKSTKNKSKIHSIVQQFWKKKINLTKVKPVSIEPVWFYVEEKKIIGFINGFILDYGCCKEAEITNIEIKNNFKNKGYGKLLMNQFLSYCKNKKVSTISLRVEKTNLIAKKLYLSYKFKLDKDAIILNLKLK